MKCDANIFFRGRRFEQRKIERAARHALNSVIGIAAVLVKFLSTRARMNHATRHANGVPQDCFLKARASKRFQPARADCKIYGATGGMAARPRIAAALAHVNGPTRAREIHRKQAACESGANNDYGFVHATSVRSSALYDRRSLHFKVLASSNSFAPQSATPSAHILKCEGARRITSLAQCEPVLKLHSGLDIRRWLTRHVKHNDKPYAFAIVRRAC